MKVLVQKYGGTSLATAESQNLVIEKIKEGIKNYEGVLVVVSAMGRRGDPYATDTLLELVGLGTVLSMSKDMGTVLLKKELDLLLSCGEIISTVVVSRLLNQNGLKACALTGGEAGIITDNQHMNAEVINVEKEYLERLLSEGYIPVVAGFQGRATNNEITTIGRGGSDTSAALLGEALGVETVEIYTDVDGILTADPRVCPTAKPISEISYTEVFQMADSGAKVIHPRAVEIARRAGFSLIIKNTFSKSEGTRITSHDKLLYNKAAYMVGNRSGNAENDKGYGKTTSHDATGGMIFKKIITSIAHRKERMQFSVEGQMTDEKFFQELAANGVSIDIINIFPQRRVFTVEQDKKNIVLDVLSRYPVCYNEIENCCKITVIGERMTGVPGVMAKIITSLAQVGVEILQTADSLSTIACLVKEEDLEKAVNALHKSFELE